MNPTIYLLENPTLLLHSVVAQIPAAAVFFGITYFVLRKVTRIKTRYLVGLAYFVAPAFILALSAWSLRAKNYSDGIQLLVPASLSVLSCAALYYQEWRRKPNSVLFPATACELPIDLENEQQLELVANDIQIAESQTVVKPRKWSKQVDWAALRVSLVFVGIAVILLWLVGSGIPSIWNKPNYIIEDVGEYGYKQLDKSAADQSVRMFRYAGVHNGKHQVFEQNISGEIEFAYECAVPCKAIKAIAYADFSPLGSEKGAYLGKNFIPADTESAEARAMRDALNGYLKVQPVKPATLKFYQVQIETGMEGVPIRPIFSEEGIRFEYMADAPRRETQKSRPSIEKQGGTQKSNLIVGSSESATAVPSPSS